jgi:CheY-like chemotaxis protein
LSILLVEDDALFADSLKEELVKAFQGVTVETIPTESRFRQSLPDIERSPPSVIVIDVMLRWDDPRPDMPAPPSDVEEEGFYTAGLRCQTLLASNSRTKQIPVILYTILDPGDVERAAGGPLPGVRVLKKAEDMTPLAAAIEAITGCRRS